METKVNVTFIGNDISDKRMCLVMNTIQTLAKGNGDLDIQDEPDMYKYEIEIINDTHMLISKGYGDDRNKIRISLDFGIKDDMEFCKHVVHMLHVYLYDLQAQDFGAFQDDKYAWMLKNALSTYQFMLKYNNEYDDMYGKE